MTIKKSKPVALERGGDLTTLFGMVGYGPAVALAITAVLGVWAVFIIYRTVRGRRKTRDIKEKEAVNPPGETPEEEEEEEKIASSEESTEASDEGLPEMLGSKSEGPQEDASGTQENSDLSAEESDGDWQAIDEGHPGSPSENGCGASEHLADQEEPAGAHVLRDEIAETGHLTGTETYSQTDQRREEVGLTDERRCEVVEEAEPESNQQRAVDDDHQEESEHPGVVLGATDLKEPQSDPASEEQEVEINGREEVTNEKTLETDTDAIEKDVDAPFPQADSDSSASVGRVEYYEVSDVCQPEECVDDPVTSRQAENDPEAVIGPQGPAADQSQQTEHPESPKDDDRQDSPHHGVIDPLNELMEDIISNLTGQVDNSTANDGDPIDPSGEVTSEDRITGSNDQPGEMLGAGDSNRVDLQSDQTEDQITSMIDQLMEPTEVKDAVEISEVKGRSVDKILIVKEEEETHEKTEIVREEEETHEKTEIVREVEETHEKTEIVREVEETHEKTEINIMEATMENNEWMTVGTTDGNIRDLPWLRLNNWSWVTLPESEPRPSSDQQDVTAKHADRAEEDPKAAIAGDQGGEAADAGRPLPQTVRVSFRVHYLTPSPRQTVAVTGDQEELGRWGSPVPLERSPDGFWSGSVSLPPETPVEWKFVLLEEGRVRRWEECSNRRLDTGHGEDVHLHQRWGFL